MDLPILSSQYSYGYLDAIVSNLNLPQAITPTKGVKEKVKLLLEAEFLHLYHKSYESWEQEHHKLVDYQTFYLEVNIGPHEGLGVTIIGEKPVRVSNKIRSLQSLSNWCYSG